LIMAVWKSGSTRLLVIENKENSRHELGDIQAAVEELSGQHVALNSQLRALRRAELDLAEDIEVKRTSLGIDNGCMEVRKYEIISY
jgi:hypothetical protein